MNRTRLLLGAMLALATSLMSISVAAADLDESHQLPHSKRWAGPYVGIVIGVGSTEFAGKTRVHHRDDGFFLPNEIDRINSTIGNRSSNHTFFSRGGIKAGYNWQFANWVIGLEADWSDFRSEAKHSIGPTEYQCCEGLHYTLTQTAETDWLLTLRPRIGFVVSDSLMVFATGGLAVTNVKAGFDYTDTFVTTGARASQTETIAGYVVGGGAEMLFGSHWALGIEYLYASFDAGSLDVNNVKLSRVANGNGFSHETDDLSFHIGRIGLNYRF